MFPVLFSIGKFNIYSYGVLLALGFLTAIFLVWRLSRAWDLDEEKTLDLTWLSLLGGLVIARIVFVLEHLQFFLNSGAVAVLTVNKNPGFSFWGAILGAVLILYFLSNRKKDNFLQALDIASVGFLAGLIFSSIGCFLGSCDVGVPSNLFFAVSMAGQLGKRFPAQALEALLLSWALARVWKVATHFHQKGKVFSIALIYIGVINLLVFPVKQTSGREVWSAVILPLAGIYLFYKVTGRKLIRDLKAFLLFFYRFPTDSRTRKDTLDRLKKYWYNQKIAFSWNFKKTLRRFNVRLSYKNTKQY